MTDPTSQPPPVLGAAAPAAGAGLKATLLIAYALFVLAPFNGATAIAGVVLVYVRRGEARGTLWESHARNLIHLFWTGVLFAAAIVAIVLKGFGLAFFETTASGDAAPALAGLLFLLVPGLVLVCVGFTVWYLYRALRGLLRALESKPY